MPFSLRLRHHLLSFLQPVRDSPDVVNQALAQSDKQKFLNVGRQPQICGRLALRQRLDPSPEFLHRRALRHHEVTSRIASVIVGLSGTLDKLVVDFVRFGCEELVDQLRQHLEIALVIDLAAIHLGDQAADHVPWYVVRGDVGAVVGNCINPCVDNIRRALVLPVPVVSVYRKLKKQHYT